MIKLIIYIIIFFKIQIGFSQIFIQSESLLYIEENVTLFSQIDIENYGEISNNGFIHELANWRNYNQYLENHGTIDLAGNTPQYIYHNNQKIYNLLITGGGTKNLLSGIEIVGQINLQNGIVFIDNTDTLIVNQSTEIINASSSSFINGRLFYSGGNFRFFPIGKNNTYAPIEISNLSNTNILTGMEVFMPNINTQSESDIKQVSTNQYWQLLIPEMDLLNAKISVSFDTVYSFDDANNLIVVETDSIQGVFRNIGNSGLYPINFQGISSQLLSRGSIFTLGTKYNIYKFYLPNAISKLATNPEDQVFKIYGDYLKSDNFHFKVFNSWNNIIYETSFLDDLTIRGWDGKNNKTGKREMPGTYTYIIKAKDINNKEFMKSGLIIILD